MPMAILSSPVAEAARRVVRLDIVEPSGRVVPYYSRNLVTLGTEASITLPLAARH